MLFRHPGSFFKIFLLLKACFDCIKCMSNSSILEIITPGYAIIF